MKRINNGWEFISQWSEAFLRGEEAGAPVRLPHTVAETPLHYADSDAYQMVCGYRRTLSIPADWKGQRLFLQFDGAAHIATVYCNGRELATHRCGYTAFRVELTQAVVYGGDNRVAVRLDTTENPAVPPFGFVIDYLTYGGLYRDVWLDVRPQAMVTDLFVHTPTCTTAQVSWQAEGADAPAAVELLGPDGAVVLRQEVPAGQTRALLELSAARPWTLDDPVLYRCRVTLGEDRAETTFGFRTAQFRGDGFYLNGEKVFLRGLNRHQCWPYVGCAAPERLQREDARILKHELQCNTVRTSHYPQSPYFLDACDREGLLVFTELPGWQHIGDEGWKEQACENVREMILQARNHPSIILWGVRINESLDDDPFYLRTNAIAHQLDPSRATTGVRYLEKSSLLEDVYAYNDFSHTGQNPGVRPKGAVTPDLSKALLISECNGHMYPTKPFDPWERRQEHALRHARVQDAARADGGHAGCCGWCMFDYPTHKDFGSGDRVCYHGVLDAFRNPKLAAALYASQGEEIPVLEVGSSMDIGDYPGGQIGPVYVFTNGEEVELYKNDAFVARMTPSGWKGLTHGPIPVDDTIGALLESQEGFPKAKADALRACLLSARQHGLAGMPLRDKVRMLGCMVRYHLTYQDGVALYNKYVGNWGGAATRWRFDAKVGGQVVASVTRAPSTALHLEVRVSHTALTEGPVYDLAAVRVRVLDEYGSQAPYAQLPVTFSLSGDLALVGPETVAAEGGACGTYVRTVGRGGSAVLTVSTPQTPAVTVPFVVTIEEE
jgi:beta-galactosidase